MTFEVITIVNGEDNIYAEFDNAKDAETTLKSVKESQGVSAYILVTNKKHKVNKCKNSIDKLNYSYYNK